MLQCVAVLLHVNYWNLHTNRDYTGFDRFFIVLQCVAIFCVAVCCSVLQCVAIIGTCAWIATTLDATGSIDNAVRVLQGVAVWSD